MSTRDYLNNTECMQHFKLHLLLLPQENTASKNSLKMRVDWFSAFVPFSVKMCWQLMAKEVFSDVKHIFTSLWTANAI